MQSITWEAVRTGLNNKDRSQAEIKKNASKLATLVEDESMTPYERARRIIIDNPTVNPGWADQRGIQAQIPDLREGIRERAEPRASEVLSLRGRPGRDVGDAGAGVGARPAEDGTTDQAGAGVSEQRTIVYRSGDLVNKGEPRGEAESGRSTGHFGTGFYFFGDRGRAESNAESRNRPVSELDITDYNLAPASYFLHAALQEVNKRAARSKGRHVITPKEIQYAQIAVEQGPSFRDFYYMDDALRVYKDQLLDEGTAQRIAAEATRRYNEETSTKMQKFGRGMFLDSASTAVMKALGYEGVNAVGTELDNYTYGTVIYDIRPGVSEQRTAPNGQPSNLNEVRYLQSSGRSSADIQRGITEFTEEGADRGCTSGLREYGVSFTSVRDLAQGYAKGRAERVFKMSPEYRPDVDVSPSVYAAFLKIDNPFVYDAKLKFFPHWMKDIPYMTLSEGLRYGKSGRAAFEAVMGGNDIYDSPYDGAVVENVNDINDTENGFQDKPRLTESTGTLIQIPFSSKPTIKLADGSNTTFSSASANISEQRTAP